MTTNTTFRSAVEAALNELDNRPDLDHWRVYSADRLSESILAHLTAWALASVEREDSEEVVGWVS